VPSAAAGKWLDRWGRSLLDLIVTLQELYAVGVGFVSLTEALDMTTPGGGWAAPWQASNLHAACSGNQFLVR